MRIGVLKSIMTNKDSNDKFRTAFLSEAVDYICEKEPHTLYIRDLVYKQVITCKDCVRKSGCVIRMMFDFGDDFYCKNGTTNEDK